MSRKNRRKLQGIVQKVIKSPVSGRPEKAQIAIQEANKGAYLDC